jgi:hypothetical protein
VHLTPIIYEKVAMKKVDFVIYQHQSLGENDPMTQIFLSTKRRIYISHQALSYSLHFE